jgi:fibronectin-binding autotransporter adhesin
MAVIATTTLVRPGFTINDSVSPAALNAVTLTAASVVVTGAVADDGSTPISGTQFLVNVTASGALTVAGSTALAGLTTSGAATLASAAVTGTLGVTGTTTLGGTLGVTGTTTMGVLNSGTHAITGNGTVSGTFGVTGTTTLGALNSGTHVITGNSTVSGTKAITGNTTVGGTLGVTGVATLPTIAGTNQGGVVKTVFSDHIFLSVGKNLYGAVDSSLTFANGTFNSGLTVGPGAQANLAIVRIGANGAVTQEMAHGYLDTTVTLGVNGTTSVTVNVFGTTSNKAVCSTNHSGLLASCGQISGGNVTVTLRNVSGVSITSASVKVSVLTMFG